MRPPVPAVGGYEGVGEVHSVGSAVKELRPGDWVIPSPLSSGKNSWIASLVLNFLSANYTWIPETAS